MTKEELAALLDKRQSADEITEDEEAETKADGLVVAFICENEHISIRGAIYAQLETWANHTFQVDPEGHRPEWKPTYRTTPEQTADHLRRETLPSVTLTTKYHKETSWRIETTVPHATFQITRHQQPYCQGIVFHRSALVVVKVEHEEPSPSAVSAA